MENKKLVCLMFIRFFDKYVLRSKRRDEYDRKRQEKGEYCLLEEVIPRIMFLVMVYFIIWELFLN